MAIRLGIELSPVASRIVAIDVPRVGRTTAETRVKFATTVHGGGAAQTALASLRGQRASVVVWASRVEHRQVVVADGAYEDMQAEARAAVRSAGCSAEATLADIAPLSGPEEDSDRRTVLFASAPRDDVAALIKPLTDAGIRVERLLTPAAALLSLARARRQPDHDALEAYIALDETRGCLAMIRAGVLLGAVNLDWGFVEESGGRRTVRTRNDIAGRLADDIMVFMNDCRLGSEQIGHICVCGGVPDVRSMSMTLMEQLDVEVEPLDSLFAIDETTVPGNADEFRDHAPSLRLAWAVAADPHPPIDLFRIRRRQAWAARVSHAVIAAGTVAGLITGWAIQDRWQPVVAASAIRESTTTLEPVTSIGQASGRNSASEGSLFDPEDDSVGSDGLPLQPVDLAAANHDPEPPISRPIFRAVREPVPLPPPVIPPFMMRPLVVMPVPIRPPINTPAPAVSPGTPAPTPGPVVAPAPVRPTTITPTPVRPPVVSPVQIPRSGQRQSAPPQSEPARPANAARAEPAPFDADLDSILYASDRRLALVDGRIVEAGDVVRGATVVEITTTAVMLRDDRGQLRRLTANGRGR